MANLFQANLFLQNRRLHRLFTEATQFFLFDGFALDKQTLTMLECAPFVLTPLEIEHVYQ